MIFDWKNDKSAALQNGIYENTLYVEPPQTMKADDGIVAHHTFRNFENLTFEEGTVILDCVFEDCENVTFDECIVKTSTFERIDTLYLSYSKVGSSVFRELTGEGGLVISLDSSTIADSTFDNIKLYDDSYLCDGSGDCEIKGCTFTRIRSERDDKEILHGTDFVGTLFRREQEFCIYDDTCIGLDDIGDL